MGLKLCAEYSNELPKLGWIAMFDRQAATVRIVCGLGVEIGSDFVVEGVWDGPFQDGGFHRAEHFFGSGLRIDREQVFVVPSHGLVDRVVLARRGGLTFASNSLILMLAATGDALDFNYDYRACCHAVISGVQNYDPNIPVQGIDEQGFWQGFRTPQLLNEEGFRRCNMPPPRQLDSFDDYYQNLFLALQAIMENARSTARRNPIENYTTISTGYDSAAVSALAKEFCTTRGYTTFGGRTLDGMSLEDGRPIANALGLEALELKPCIPDLWHEQLILAATFDGRESLYANMFQSFVEQDAVACLWTGYHGDKVWDRSTAGEYLNPDLRRGDMSGFNLSEARLDVGFINFSVPFMFASSLRDLVEIAGRPEMSAWQVGGDYDRPVPRRIAEERGIPRDLFGQRKSVIMEYYTYCRNPELANKFKQFLDNQSGYGPLARASYRIAEQLDYWWGKIPTWAGRKPIDWSARDMLRPGASNLANSLYVWAVNESKEAYARKCADVLNRLLQSG